MEDFKGKLIGELVVTDDKRIEIVTFKTNNMREVKFRVRRLDAKFVVAVEWLDAAKGWQHYLTNYSEHVMNGAYDCKEYAWINNSEHIREQYRLKR